VMVLREQLERLIDDLVSRGIRYEDAHREFEKRFIAHVLAQVDGNLCKAADLLGMHRNTLSRKMTEYRLKSAARALRWRRRGRRRRLTRHFARP